MKPFILLFAILLSTSHTVIAQSVYTQLPDDPEALYFTCETFNIKADGKHDVSKALQSPDIQQTP